MSKHSPHSSKNNSQVAVSIQSNSNILVNKGISILMDSLLIVVWIVVNNFVKQLVEQGNFLSNSPVDSFPMMFAICTAIPVLAYTLNDTTQFFSVISIDIYKIIRKA